MGSELGPSSGLITQKRSRRPSSATLSVEFIDASDRAVGVAQWPRPCRGTRELSSQQLAPRFSFHEHISYSVYVRG